MRLRQLPSECGTHSGPVLRKKDINRCTSLRVLPCSWAPRSNRRNPRSLRTFPPRKPPAFPPLTNPRMHRPQQRRLPTTRVSWSSSGPATRFSFSFRVLSFSFFFSFSFYRRALVCDRKGFDGPRGDFPGRRGPTEGASHTRLGHEPRPSDLLKISIALVHRPSRPPSRARRKAQTGPPSTALLPPSRPVVPALFFARVPPSFSPPRAVGTARHR